MPQENTLKLIKVVFEEYLRENPVERERIAHMLQNIAI